MDFIEAFLSLLEKHGAASIGVLAFIGTVLVPMVNGWFMRQDTLRKIRSSNRQAWIDALRVDLSEFLAMGKA